MSDLDLTEAVEAAAAYLFGQMMEQVPPEPGCTGYGKTWDTITEDQREQFRDFDARGVVDVIAPLIASQATADLLARIEALRNEWQSGTDERCGCPTCRAARLHAAALDALIGGAK